MANYISPDALDALLEYVKDEVTVAHLCVSEVNEYSDISAATMGNSTVSSSNFGSPYDYSSDDRRINVTATPISITVTAAGTATHVALASATEMLYCAVFPTALSGLVIDDIVTVGSWYLTARNFV